MQNVSENIVDYSGRENVAAFPLKAAARGRPHRLSKPDGMCKCVFVFVIECSKLGYN